MPLGTGLGLAKEESIIGAAISNPAALSGCIFWFDSKQESNGALAALTDRSGSSNHFGFIAAQGTITNTRTPNGSKALVMVPTQNYGRALAPARPYTIVLVYNRTSGAGRAVGGVVNFVLGTFSADNQVIFTGAFVVDNPASLNAWNRLTLKALSADSIGYLGKTLAGNNAAGLTDWGTTLIVGSNNGGAEPFTGDIAALIIYNRALSDGERSQLDDWLLLQYFTIVTLLLANGVDHLLLTTGFRLLFA